MEHVDEAWRKSTYSGSNGGGCLEAGQRPATIVVRDSKLTDSPMLRFSADAWRRFTAELKQG
jgi:hypothetical protein